MVTAQVQTYQGASKALLDLGFAELAQGDARQASERGWDATVLMLKAVAVQRGWQHQGCRPIRRVASRLAAEETDGDEIRWLYRVAHSLHINFYEDLDTAEDVRTGLEDVRRLMDKLASFLGVPEIAIYRAHPETNVVHREGGCWDVRNHGDAWICLGRFSCVEEEKASNGGSACGNCFPRRRAQVH